MIIHTGVFLIWRAMIKYMETLHREDEFRNTKGMLLENWCYEQALNKGFEVRKIIITNTNKTPTNKYKLMKEQIQDFNGLVEGHSFKFPKGHEQFYFGEFDIVIRIKEFLVLIECKGTIAPIQEGGDYLTWTSNYHKNMTILDSKTQALEFGIKNNLIKNDFLSGIKEYVPLMIQTEGIFSEF